VVTVLSRSRCRGDFGFDFASGPSGQPWTDFIPETGNDGAGVLLAYARCFYFGD
jgi:hypothetical protein